MDSNREYVLKKEVIETEFGPMVREYKDWKVKRPYVPRGSEIDSWATRLGALAVLTFVNVREGEYSSLYQACLFWAGCVLSIYAMSPMVRFLYRFTTERDTGLATVLYRCFGLVIPVCFVFSTVVISASLLRYLFLNSPMPQWIP